jgi:hypothetical protein
MLNASHLTAVNHPELRLTANPTVVPGTQTQPTPAHSACLVSFRIRTRFNGISRGLRLQRFVGRRRDANLNGLKQEFGRVLLAIIQLDELCTTSFPAVGLVGAYGVAGAKAKWNHRQAA